MSTPSQESEEERRKRVWDVVNEIARRTGHKPRTITVEMVGTKDVEAFIKMVLDAQEELKRNPPKDFLIKHAA